MNRMTVSTRLTLGFSLVLALLAIIMGMAIMRLSDMNAGIAKIVQDAYPQVRLAQGIRDNINWNARAMRNAMLTTDAETAKTELNIAVQNSADNNEAFAKLEQLIQTEKGKKLFNDVKESSALYRPAADKLIRATNEGNKDLAVSILFGEMRSAQKAYFDTLAALINYQTDMMDATYKAAEETYQNARMTMIILGILALVLGASSAFIITRTLLKQLGGEPDYAAAIAGKIAAGDLSVSIQTKENDKTSLLYAMKTMRDSLVRIVAEVRAGTDTIAISSSEIAAGNHDLSSRTEQQASSLEETASSMEELTSTVKQNADNARQANQLAEAASGVAVKGGKVVTQVVDTMGSINESARKIVDIIGVIDGIAFQTNILALNAAVEAARAGEQGRGFAVVASEVRNLAQRSAAAAKEIKTLIGDSVEKVDAGSKLVGVAGSTMEEIVDSVKRVTDIMAEITAATQEQSAGIEQVNQAIGQMDQVTQQNAALVEQAAAASESMQDQASNLAQVVSVFKLDGMQTASVAAIPHKTRQATAGNKALTSKPRTAIAASKPKRLEPQMITNGEWEQF
ncbi:MAG: chemotaxis protein [Streptosporangiaceae bacterium]|nr:chemotaxis protein [Streptosporangiaceae bacterium]